MPEVAGPPVATPPPSGGSACVVRGCLRCGVFASDGGFSGRARGVVHLVVGEDGEMQLPLRRLHVSGLQEEEEGIGEGCGGGVASRGVA